jgi:hypothetical protein
VNAAEFVEALREEFADMAGELDDEDWGDDPPYPQTFAFARFTRSAVDHGHRALVRRCFHVADQAAVRGDDELQNAIAVAYLEHLNFQDGKVHREWAFDLLTERLKAFAADLGIGPGYR